MKERVDIVDAELRDYDWPEYLNQIDTRNLNIDQTIKLIENIVS